jgi:molybdenum-dependent DNA-binding transcriptional regulator ModE
LQQKCPPSGFVRRYWGEREPRSEEMLRLSLRDRDRLVLLRQVAAKELTVRRGAERAGLSVRHFRRLLRRFEREGDRAVIHRARGRPPNNC